MSRPSQKALRAARQAEHNGGDAAVILDAAHDQALGLSRSVCLRDVLELLEEWDATPASRHELASDMQVHFFIARTLGDPS
jgi:hypothetical protein